MPLHIIRQDITRVRCDVVAYPDRPALASDGNAPYDAAGLRARYLKCLDLAAGHGAAIIACPLIGLGTPDGPQDTGLRIAVDVITSWLLTHEADVYLVVNDKQAFTVSEALFGAVRSYVDEHYTEPPRLTAHRKRAARSGLYAAPACKPSRETKDQVEECLKAEARPLGAASFYAAEPKDAALVPARDESPMTLEDRLRHMDVSFSLKLQMLIDEKGFSDVDCYKRANVSKQTWYKILNDPGYKPSKTTVLCFAVALRLTFEETQALLGTVGYTLSRSSKADVIVEYFISNGIYDLLEIDGTLLRFDQPTLGAYA